MWICGAFNVLLRFLGQNPLNRLQQFHTVVFVTFSGMDCALLDAVKKRLQKKNISYAASLQSEMLRLHHHLNSVYHTVSE